MHSLGIVQWDSTRRDHPGYPGRVSGSGPVKMVDRLVKRLTGWSTVDRLVNRSSKRSSQWSPVVH